MNIRTVQRRRFPDGGDRESGSAFVTLLFFAMIITMAAGNVAVMARNQRHMARVIIARTTAQQIAEGAAAQALAYIAEDIQRITQPPSALSSGSMGQGEYEVTIESGQFDLFTVVSVGTAEDQSRTVRVHARLPIDLAGLQNAMFSNADIEIVGTGQIISTSGNGDIHANQNVDMGGSTSISGSASAVGNVTVRGAASVGGALLPGSRHINFPQLDLDHYFQVAQANNQVHVGDMQMNGTSHTPPGGVLWVVGDLNTSAHVTFNGLLVVTGDVHQAGHFTHNQVDDLPAIIVRDGNLHLSGQSVIQGLIYVKSGRVDITGGTNLQGAVVAWGDIKTRGNWGLIDFVEQEPEQEGGNAIEVLAWEL